MSKITAHSLEFRAATRALAWGGCSAFSTLYCLQPIMPILSTDFRISATAASGVISAATVGMAVALIPASILARRYGLKLMMCLALGLSALFTLLAACMGGLTQLLVCRGLLGIALAGFPAIAMAYLSEEIEAAALGRAMGIYIAGNALGGLSGRWIVAFLTEWISWRAALACLGVFGMLIALAFWRILPTSRNFRPQRFDRHLWWKDAYDHWSDAGLPWLFMQGFLLMGCYVSLYNYLGYRLVAPPFGLRPSWLGAVFSMNLVGMFASTWVGRLADRYGRRHVLWLMVAMMMGGLLLTMVDVLLVLVLGLAIFTFGFFGAHAIVSSWVGRRAHHAKALAASFYLCAYYLGSSCFGSFTGLLWERWRWYGVVVFLLAVLVLCMAIAFRLRTLTPKEIAT